MLLVLVACLCVFGYWVKSSAGINLFKGFSLSAHFPFSLLMPDYTVYPQEGQVILLDTFELSSSEPVDWLSITSTRPEALTVNYSETCVESSRCLVVKNTEYHQWHISHRNLVAVQSGDTFSMEAIVWHIGKEGWAEIQVSAIDDEGRVISRNRWHAGPETQGTFEHIRQQFTVDPGIAMIRFRLAGKGKGEYRFDDVVFKRLKRAQ